MLTRLWARDVEPFDKPLELDLGSRLNLLCGDNGLGKTFVLDLAWYVLTGTWSQRPVLPKRDEGAKPAFGCRFARAEQEDEDEQEHRFDFEYQEWS
jgi:AAA domain